MDEGKSRVVIEGESKTRIKDPFRNFMLTLIALSLIAIAIPTLYDFKLTLQANEDAKAKAAAEFNVSSNNIVQAKNTLFDGGIVGILLDSFQHNTTWSFFIANTGNYIVDATGIIDNPSDFLTTIKKTNRVSYSNSINELETLDPTNVKQMNFKVQFQKRLGEVFETEYNHYQCLYSEITVIFKNGTSKTINTMQESILDYFEAYLQDSLNK